MTYSDYWRLIDQHGVLHLADATMLLGEWLCGTPPTGNAVTDAAGSLYAPGDLTRPYVRVCDDCNGWRG